MIRVGVFSDSHGDRNALEKLLDKMGHIDAACFLGDISSDAMFLREQLAEDAASARSLCRSRAIMIWRPCCRISLLIELGGHKIWMEHGHLFPSLMTLAYRAKDNGADIALFGHTHEPHVRICLRRAAAQSRFGGQSMQGRTRHGPTC